jgi:tellurite resistance protein TehA-like permease
MGATAITALAGSHLVLSPHAPAFLPAIRPFVLGVTLLLWVWGSWWIPALVVLGLWKYGVVRDRLTYDPALWTIVFPLGMYTAACETLAGIEGLHLVQGLVRPFLWSAVAAWCAVAALFLRHRVWPRRPRGAREREHPEGHRG